jgi:predicted branched-subunit amino acid permease
MKQENLLQFRRGMRHGVPIALGYFAVAFTLGIAAKHAGLTAIQAAVNSLLIHASAGEYAGITLIAACASYFEVAVMEAVANARYLLMSCALSQKLEDKTPLWQRALLGFGVTDEVFGISVAVPGYLNPFYSFGAMAAAIPAWAMGSAGGVIMGNILPDRIVSALSVGLYGMFIAIIIPPAKRNRVVAALILISFALSFLFDRLPLFDFLSEGVRIILLTVVISLGAALFFPLKAPKQEDHDEA